MSIWMIYPRTLRRLTLQLVEGCNTGIISQAHPSIVQSMLRVCYCWRWRTRIIPILVCLGAKLKDSEKS
ncbi:hypothetical protein GGF41_001236 [Coemansia sp. RSA 2531]|nr:hypothetical protein GGF41_001236 [Coemansia sp. RSA 2531]